ncbi:MAG: fructose-bisphosphatase class III, partial [Oscillospiraceae bacterium]|nr:fructose-bisphosphatase class III [Oscillospiraceae bacterium]
ISDFPLYEAVDAGERTFVLVHSGLGNFRRDKKLRDYTVEEMTMTRTDPDIRLFDDESIFIVSGPTPTLAITGKPQVYKSANNICIDCGAPFTKGRLACVCLDTLDEYYV